MPIYEYQCSTCGHTFEREQAITEDPLRECPICRNPVHRLISGGLGFLFPHGGTARIGGEEKACRLQNDGHTCCGRDQRCDRPPCQGEQ